MSNSRFIIKYCGILDSMFILDTLERMPLTMVIDKVKYVHGFNCQDSDRAEDAQEYFEKLCGFQRDLFQEVKSFTIKSNPWLGHYSTEYNIYDNLGNHVMGSMDKSFILKFKEWLEMEVSCNGIC